MDFWRNQKFRQGLVKINLIKVRKYGGCLIYGSIERQGNLRILSFQANYGVILEGDVEEEVKNLG